MPIKFTHWNGIFQRFLVYSQNYATITTINFRKFSSPPKEILYPLPVTHHFSETPPSLGYHKSTLSFLDLPVLIILYKWNHTRYGLLWLASFIWHNVFWVQACGSKYQYILNSTLLLNSIPLWTYQIYLSIHQIMDIWVVSTCWLGHVSSPGYWARIYSSTEGQSREATHQKKIWPQTKLVNTGIKWLWYISKREK